MTIESEIAALTQATTDLLSAVNVRKTVLDEKVGNADAFAQASLTSANNAAASAAAANTKAGEAVGSAASALAIYGNTAAQQAAVTAAQNAASVAAGHAASASSVVQQDLSGVNAAALHRSPNAVTAMFVYDTSKDSDGGAWTEKCQHTSWYNEAINGKWLGAQASEAAARAVSGATTGDYFQLTTDGKFYKLNATSGITEVFRGNKRDFPRLAGVVAEAANVTIYDLTEPGRPMWMRFKNGSNTFLGFLSADAATKSVLMLAGKIVIGTDVHGNVIDFAKDDAAIAYSQASSGGSQYHEHVKRTIASRLSNGGIRAAVAGLGYSIPNGNINAVAMTVLPDAPVDPVTGLQVPTILVATSGGVSVIKHNGTVVTNSGGGNYTSIAIVGATLLGRINQSAGTWFYATTTLGSLAANFTMQGMGGQFSAEWGTIKPAGQNVQVFVGGGNRINTMRLNRADANKPTVSSITNTFNTGHQVGDIRRTYLSDIEAGTAGNDLVTNGSFSGVADGTAVTTLAGWSAYSTPTNRDIQGEKLRITATAGSQGASLTVTTVVGKRYVFSVTATGDLGAASIYSDVKGDVSTVSGNVRVAFTATATSTVFFFRAANNAAGTTYYDNISVVEAVADRSYKAAAAHITGILAKTAVASAAQMVAYSGFSAANYLREPYSADMDFGTGEWSASAWVSIPTANAAAGIIVSRAHSSGSYITLGIDATNKVTATVFDGTTTRTVTTTAAYNTGTWLKARVNYTTDGSLSILVNGQEVAVTRGAPLLTLNNPNAVLTIGNSYAADAPFPGSIALLKFSATVPTPEQSVWMYEQEKQMFREGAQCCLPDSGTIVDLAYDDATDKWIAVSATNESEWSGLVRTSVTPVPAGSYTKAAAASGVQLLARSTTNPGVDITIPAYGLREELVKRAESAARLNAQLATFDYVGGFTASTTTGSTSITSVAGLSYPVSAVGAQVTGAGIPAGTAITAVSGATAYLSKAATATGTAVQISFTDFILPVGYEAKAVLSAGSVKTEGSTKDYTRLFDGFKETIRFGAAPGYQAAVQIQATRSAT